MRYLVINTKNYLEAAGKRLDVLASVVEDIPTAMSLEGKITIYLAVPAFYLRDISLRFPKVNLLAQHLDDEAAGSSTGYLVPEIANECGALGSLINHSEHRIQESKVASLVERLRRLKMKSVVCARDEKEVGRFAGISPDFIAIEPPELIGSGNAVSKARPQIIVESKKILEKSKPAMSTTCLLCGAGIVEEMDARIAVELGSSGILVASGVVKSPNWRSKIESLARGIICEAQK